MTSVEREDDIQRLFNIVKNQNAAPEISERDLINSGGSERMVESIFVPVSIRNAYEKLPQETKDRYKWYGEEYYARIIDYAQNSIEVTAKTLLMQVKSGLSFNDLTDDEMSVLRSIYGKDWYILADRTQEEYDQYEKELSEKVSDKVSEKVSEEKKE